MSGEDESSKSRKSFKLMKPKDGANTNPMARLARLGSGPDVKLTGAASTSTGAPSSSGSSSPFAAATTATTATAATAATAAASQSPAPSAITKKIFAPNLMPKARKDPTDSQVKPPKKKLEPRTDRGRGRGGRGRGGRGRGFGGFQNHIQSTSIFEEGPLPETQKGGNRGPSYGGGGGGGESIRESISISSKASRADPERTKEMLKKLFSDDFISDAKLESTVAPVSLPLYEEEGEEEDRKKAEIILPNREPNRKRKAEVVDVLTPPSDAVDDPRAIFIQLPDSLPFDLRELGATVNAAAAIDEDKKESTPAASSAERVTERDPNEAVDDDLLKPLADDPNATTLQKLPEGQIGTVRIRASGKCELAFPNGFVFDLSLGTPSGFLQEFVSVSLDEHLRTGEMRSLGTLNHKIIAVPNFETLLKNSVRL